jgi:hypothetical protein
MESTDKILVYDDACPLCVAYTGAFVKTVKPHNWVNYLYLPLLTIFVFKEYFRRMDYANILNRYRLIVSINLACIIGLCICLFVPFNK